MIKKLDLPGTIAEELHADVRDQYRELWQPAQDYPEEPVEGKIGTAVSDHGSTHASIVDRLIRDLVHRLLKPPGVGHAGVELQRCGKHAGAAAVSGAGRFVHDWRGVEVSERWPVQLAAALRKEGIDIGDPQIIAVTGWTTADLAGGMDREDPQGPFDLVSLQIGVNNQYQGRPAKEYREELDNLLKRAIQLAGDRPSRVLVVSIPDYSVTPFAAGDRAKIAKAIDQFNEIKRAAAQRFKVQYVNVMPSSRQAADDRALIAEDGLHPSAKMYGLWAELALPVVRKELQPNDP